MSAFKPLFLLLFFISVAQAEQSISASSHSRQTALLELYTSEGCSSCPPADLWLSQVVKDDALDLNVLALAFHVDYWDYIGWKDRFASPQYTSRQRKLSQKNRMSTMYTPGFFINDREARGTRSMLPKLQPENQPLAELPLELTVSLQANEYAAEVKTPESLAQSHKLQYIIFEDNLKSDVKRGENSGRVLKHERVVRYISPMFNFDSSNRHIIPLKNDWNPKHQGVAALIKTQDGEYLQSVHVTLDKI